MQNKVYPILGKENLKDIDKKMPVVRVEQNLKMVCPYCGGGDFVLRGTRAKKHEVVQLYKCKNLECAKSFISGGATEFGL